MSETASSVTAAPWTGAPDAAPRAVSQKIPRVRMLPALGPLLLFVLWDLVVRFGAPEDVLPRLVRRYDVGAVYCHGEVTFEDAQVGVTSH